MTKKKLITLSKGEENINSDCQSIEEPKGWRFDWRKIIPLEPTAELIILVLLALLYGGFYYYKHYTVNESNIYGLWQSENHKLAISYERGRKESKRDWDIVQDGNVLIKDARVDDIKRLEDGTLYIEVYAEESLFSDLPTKNGYNYLNMYVRKDNYLTYDGESYKRIDDENKSITWNDGSKSLYGQRITLFDRLKPYIVFGIIGSMILYAIFVDWRIKRNLKRKNRLNEASKKEKI